MVARRDERIARFVIGSANPGGRLKSGDEAPIWVDTIAVADIDPDPDQPRRHFDPAKLRELGDSLVAVGQLQPVILIRSGDRYRLHVGERRWRAAQLAGLATIRAIVRATPLEARAARIAQIVENEQRDNLTTTELIDAVRALHADGLKSVEIAAALAKPKSRISELSALVGAPAELLGVADAIGLAPSYQLLLRWREHRDAALDFLRHMPPEHISRVTIATIGQSSQSFAGLDGAGWGARAAGDDRPGRSGTGKGASPRGLAEAMDPAITPIPFTDTAPLPPRPQHVAATMGALVVEHDARGEGSVVFGVGTPPDHLAIRFGDAGPVVLHKSDIRILRSVASRAEPA